MSLTCYYLDDSSEDPRLPHDSGIPVDYSEVLALGVIHKNITVSSDGKYDEVDAIMNERGYRYRDFVTLNKETLGDTLDNVIDGFYEEYVFSIAPVGTLYNRWALDTCTNSKNPATF